jgi:hypothetical protein
MSSGSARSGSTAAGAAGLVMVLGIIVLGPVLGGPDALASTAVTDYGKALAGSNYLRMAPTRFGFYALLTSVELVFFAGLWSFARQLAPRTIVPSVVALSGAAFVAGGMASDAFSLGQVIALHAGNGVRPDANVAVIADVASMVLLIEVNVCLGVAIAAICLAGLRTRSLPSWLCWFGVVAAVACAVPGFAPTTEALFIVSNLLRLAFVAALSVLFLRPRNSIDQHAVTIERSR